MNIKTLAIYQDFLTKIDAKFAEIRAKHPIEFQCQNGCHSCCRPSLTVNALEAAKIRAYIESSHTLKAELIELLARDPFQGERCTFLMESGACSIYPVRPVVCRSHGAPLQYQQEKLHLRDVCPLNFTSTPIESLPTDQTFNLDTLNLIMAGLVKDFEGTKEEPSRFPLRVDAILSE